MTQLFDPDAPPAWHAERDARDEAIATVEDHATPGWIDYARYVVRQVALANAEFISDAVWEAGLGKPPEARALGAVMTWARREGLIAPTDRVLPSTQAGCHRMPRRVWRSLIHDGGTPQ